MPSKLPLKPKQQSLKPTTLNYSKIDLPPTLPGPVCVACNDTGVSSSGMPCHPCTINKRIALRPKYNPPPELYETVRPTKPTRLGLRNPPVKAPPKSATIKKR